MGDIHMEDISGRPPSLAEVREARQAAANIVIVGIGKLPPEIAIQSTNMLRCLQFLEVILEQHAKKGRRCGSQGLDSSGHCTRCGLVPDGATECPPEFLQQKA